MFAPNGESHTRSLLTVGDTSFGEFHHILESTTPIDPTGRIFVEADKLLHRSQLGPRYGRTHLCAHEADAYEISEFD